ncbi:MAG: SDR family oxidoreductase [Oscillatoriaceae cyanobacterium Prado104]|jgi:2-deoxy-D-gluconate 3-dehydrogenase|nr:SDR family oxidoreductase [Oscillatoriaceae cyanobacterium Prado104]
MYSVEDKIAIITGAAGGIGFELAKTFAKLGAKVVAIDAKEQDSETFKSTFSGVKHQPLIITADLTKMEEIERSIALTETQWNRPDILINCLGVNTRKPIENYTPEEWDKILDVNLKSVFFMTQKVSERMKLNACGKIVSISSMMGIITWDGAGKFSLAPYSASKAGLISITKSFALALASHNITVNSVCPGFVDTPLVAAVKNDPILFEDIISRTPLRRFADTSEIVAPVLFLSTEASSYITGHSLLVDGGWNVQ